MFFVLQFLEKTSIALCLKLFRVFDNLKQVGKVFQTVDVEKNNIFWTEQVLLDGFFSSENVRQPQTTYIQRYFVQNVGSY